VSQPRERGFVFRGQACSGDALFPSIARLKDDSGKDLDSNQLLQIEQKALEEFKEQAHLYLSEKVIPPSDDLIGWWTVMQHYGSPTRLLDWTESIFVAAYFAVEKEFTSPGEIWAVWEPRASRGILPKPVNSAGFRDPGAADEVYFVKAELQTDRMKTQQTLFSVSPQITLDHGKAIDAAFAPKGEALFSRATIPAKFKLDFLARLRGMNITARSLFPGIDGLARSVGELIRVCAWSSVRNANLKMEDVRA
jgi:hypothetical protein